MRKKNEGAFEVARFFISSAIVIFVELMVMGFAIYFNDQNAISINFIDVFLNGCNPSVLVACAASLVGFVVGCCSAL